MVARYGAVSCRRWRFTPSLSPPRAPQAASTRCACSFRTSTLRSRRVCASSRRCTTPVRGARGRAGGVGSMLLARPCACRCGHLTTPLRPDIFADGSLCLDIIQDKWRPTYTCVVAPRGARTMARCVDTLPSFSCPARHRPLLSPHCPSPPPPLQRVVDPQLCAVAAVRPERGLACKPRRCEDVRGRPQGVQPPRAQVRGEERRAVRIRAERVCMHARRAVAQWTTTMHHFGCAGE